MGIPAECPECGRQYNVKDEKAGATLRCKQCGGHFDVPSRSRSRKKPKRRNNASTLPAATIPILVGVVAFVLCGVLAFKVVYPLARQKVDQAVAATTSPSPLSSPQTRQQVRPTFPQFQPRTNSNTKSNSYGSSWEKRNLQQLVRPDLMITVTFQGVDADDKAANEYFRSKLYYAVSQANFAEYQEQRKIAQEKTEANRKAAEAAAIASAKSTATGSFGYFPHTVWYRYKQEPMPDYPATTHIARDGNEQTPFRYLAGPITNTSRIQHYLEMPMSGGRDIQVTANIHDPVPDASVEILRHRHGADNVAKLIINQAVGDPKLIQEFLEVETTGLYADGKQLFAAGMKQTEDNQFEFHVAPITRIQDFGGLIPFGSVENYDHTNRTITLTANLPDPMPTLEELKLMREADRKHIPRPGVDHVEWAIHRLEMNDALAQERALDILVAEETREDQLEYVSGLLSDLLDEPGARTKKLIPAMMNWRTEDTLDTLIEFTEKSRYFGPEFLEAFAEFKNEKAAGALASMLVSQQHDKQAEELLTSFGPIAEAAVLEYVRNPEVKVRIKAYKILQEIGGQESATMIAENHKMEPDPKIREGVREVLGKIRRRVAAERKKAREAEEAAAAT